jgi:dihydrofolate synthase/folylpolyglutamate synthase
LLKRDVTFKPLAHSLDGQSLRVSADDEAIKLTIPLLGSHQVQNAAVAAATLWALRGQGLDIPDYAIQIGFSKVKWPARFEVVHREPPVIFDSAHNQDSFARLRQALDDYFPGQYVYLIFGASEDKNIPGMFAEIKQKVKRMFITKSIHPRALEVQAVQKLAMQANIPNETIPSVEEAFLRALDLSEKDGSIVLSAGSMFITAEVIAAWNNRESGVDILRS